MALSMTIEECEQACREADENFRREEESSDQQPPDMETSSLPVLRDVETASLLVLPDPVRRLRLHADPDRFSLHPTDRLPINGESDELVTMKEIRGGFDKNDKFNIVISESRVPITNLRPVEQNIAYEALLAKAPEEELGEYYTLHLSRLQSLRAEIGTLIPAVKATASMKKRCEEQARQILDSHFTRELATQAGQNYKKVVKQIEKLRALERDGMRLLTRCNYFLQLRLMLRSVSTLKEKVDEISSERGSLIDRKRGIMRMALVEEEKALERRLEAINHIRFKY